MGRTSIKTGRRGRPPRKAIERIRTKAWFYSAAHYLGKDSGYAFDIKFLREKIVRVNGITIRPCKFDKYKRGKNTPEMETIEQVDDAFPGTKAIFMHPLWAVLECPCTDIDALYIQLQRLRPKIVNLLFRRKANARIEYQRRTREYFATFESLMEEGDIDALTACLGLVQEAKYYGDDLMPIIYTKVTFMVFRRAIAEIPLFRVAKELYAYIMEYILNGEYGDEMKRNVPIDTIDKYALSSRARLHLVERYQLLKHYPAAPSSCLHVVEKYLNFNTAKKIENLVEAGRLSEISKLPEFRNLSRALRRWEKDHAPMIMQ